MVAAFETFVADLPVEIVENLASIDQAIDLTKLPEALQVANAFNSLESAMKGRRYEAKNTTKAQRLPSIQQASSIIARGELNPLAFAANFGNPSPQNVHAAFKALGIPDILESCRDRFERKWGSAIALRFLPDKLEETVQKRHRVAHRAESLDTSRKDLRQSLRFLKILAEVIDIECLAHFRNLKRRPF